MQTEKEAIEWLFSTQWFGIKPGLEPVRRLLRESLAYPAHGVKVVHVAGTNGKGSTCAMMDRILRSCGRRSGLFTSPHLEDFRERVQVDGKMIPEEACLRLLRELREACERMDPHPTFFEITLVLAMRWFREAGCEWIVLETGMGGRLDATTAVPADVCVVTPIGMDHMQWLGDTLEAIAGEKAGIFLPGVPALSAPQEPAARRELERAANEVRCRLEFIEEPLLGYPISLAGAHQRWNAALAVAALHRAGLPLREENLRHALARVNWPGRFEEFPGGVVLDGAHNPHAARCLADHWRERFGGEKARLVFGAVAGKDIGGILQHVLPLAEEVLLCPVASPRGLPLEELAALLPPDAPPSRGFADVRAALAAAREAGGPVLVAGSLFLVGEARACLTGGSFQPSSQ